MTETLEERSPSFLFFFFLNEQENLYFWYAFVFIECFSGLWCGGEPWEPSPWGGGRSEEKQRQIHQNLPWTSSRCHGNKLLPAGAVFWGGGSWTGLGRVRYISLTSDPIIYNTGSIF